MGQNSNANDARASKRIRLHRRRARCVAWTSCSQFQSASLGHELGGELGRDLGGEFGRDLGREPLRDECPVLRVV